MTTTLNPASNAQTGKLAALIGRNLPLQVLKSNAGFYIGTADEEGPCSRESNEYWPSRDGADKALASGSWTQAAW